MYVKYGQSITLDKETDTKVSGVPPIYSSIFHVTLILIEQFIWCVNVMGLVQGSQFSNSWAWRMEIFFFNQRQ